MRLKHTLASLAFAATMLTPQTADAMKKAGPPSPPPVKDVWFDPELQKIVRVKIQAVLDQKVREICKIPNDISDFNDPELQMKAFDCIVHLEFFPQSAAMTKEIYHNAASKVKYCGLGPIALGMAVTGEYPEPKAICKGDQEKTCSNDANETERIKLELQEKIYKTNMQCVDNFLNTGISAEVELALNKYTHPQTQ